MAYEGKPPLPVKVGGTGQSSVTVYAPVCGGATSTDPLQSADTAISNSGYVLTSTGASSLPTWQAGGGGGGGISNVAGDTGTATGSTITFTGVNSGKTVTFSAASSTVNLNVSDGSSNTALGSGSGANLSGSSNNTLMGSSSGGVLTSGSHNTMIGQSAGSSGSATNSSNIYIKNVGANESNTIRIGTQGTGSGQQNTCFMAGVAGVSIAANKNIVTIDNSTGQLGSDASLSVSNGGTGSTTLTGVLTGNGTSPMTASTLIQNRIVVAGASNTVTSLAAGLTGQVLAGVSGNVPAWTATPTITSVNFGGGPLSIYDPIASFTPVLQGETTAGTTTYTTQFGRVIRIGDIVCVFWKIVITAATGTGNIQIRNLPVNSTNVTNLENVGTGWVEGFAYPASTTSAFFTIIPGTNRAYVQAYAAGVPAAIFQMQNTAATVTGSMVYFS